MTYSIKETTWHKDEPHLRQIRTTVFLEEQQVPIEDEWDGQDEAAQHLIVFNDHTLPNKQNKPIACARLVKEGSALHLGRVAVLIEWRSQGIGKQLVQSAIDIARSSGFKTLVLDAQVTAIAFYQAFGFEQVGDEFLDAGIWHQGMHLSL